MSVANPIPLGNIPAFLQAAKAGGPREYALCLAGISWGFRIMELLRIRVGDVADASCHIRTSVTVQRANLKGGVSSRRRAIRSRTVPVSLPLRAALHDYLFSRFGSGAIAADEPLFAGRFPGEPLCCRQAYRFVQRFALEAGLSPDKTWSCHTLRKTYAGAVYQTSGFDIIKTQRALGHSDVQTTQRYLPMPDEAVQDVIAEAQAVMVGEVFPENAPVPVAK